MKITNVEVPFDTTVSLVCVKCGRSVDASKNIMFADVDGVPFVDYYCKSCYDDLKDLDQEKGGKIK